MAPDPFLQALPDYSFREMHPADVDAVHRMETLSYAYPWTIGVLRDSIKPSYESWLLTADSGPGMRLAGIGDERLVGYGILSVGANEAHLLNLCVHPELRGCRLGRRILHHLLARAEQREAEIVFLEVRPSNPTAHRLYLAEGFEEIARRANYYPHRQGKEDAIVLARKIVSGAQ